MSAQVVLNQIKTTYRGFIEVKEEVEMRLAREITQVKTRVFQELAAHRPAKLIGGLALGALLMTALVLPLATVNADGPSRPLVNEEIVFDRGDDTSPIDAWMHDSPFYEDFGAINRVEAQGAPIDAWLHDSPFYQDFSEVGGVTLGIAALEAQGAPNDAWMFDSPFYQDFSEVGEVEVGDAALEAQGAPIDAWIFDSPFYYIP